MGGTDQHIELTDEMSPGEYFVIPDLDTNDPPMGAEPRRFLASNLLWSR